MTAEQKKWFDDLYYDHNVHQMLPKKPPSEEGRMTGEQKKWLDDHRPEGYRPVGERPGAQAKYTRIGMLYPDGSFERRAGGIGWRYSKAEVGMFECGVFVLEV